MCRWVSSHGEVKLPEQRVLFVLYPPFPTFCFFPKSRAHKNLSHHFTLVIHIFGIQNHKKKVSPKNVITTKMVILWYWYTFLDRFFFSSGFFNALGIWSRLPGLPRRPTTWLLPSPRCDKNDDPKTALRLTLEVKQTEMMKKKWGESWRTITGIIGNGFPSKNDYGERVSYGCFLC